MTEQEIILTQQIDDLNDLIYRISYICSLDDKDNYEKTESIIHLLEEEGYM